jgi:hypothetical protein
MKVYNSIEDKRTFCLVFPIANGRDWTMWSMDDGDAIKDEGQAAAAL